MMTRAAGASGRHFPVIGLGTWSTFDTEEDRSWLVAEALGAGVNLFDSSPMYGRAEEALAAALGDRRDEAILATKISATDSETGEAQLQQALRLFGRIDLLQIHNIVAWRSHLPRLLALKRDGKIGLIGASQGLLVSDADFEEVMQSGALDVIQLRYNPRRRAAQRRLLPLAAELGLGVLVMQPLRWGVMLADPSPAELAELGVSDWAAAILRWILSDTRVTTVLTGTMQPGRITQNAKVADLPPFQERQMRLIEAVIARGGTGVHDRASITDHNADATLATFLDQRLGASYCDPCLSRSLQADIQAVVRARARLGSVDYATETGPCLGCGETGAVVRSRTIMR